MPIDSVPELEPKGHKIFLLSLLVLVGLIVAGLLGNSFGRSGSAAQVAQLTNQLKNERAESERMLEIKQVDLDKCSAELEKRPPAAPPAKKRSKKRSKKH